MKDFKDFCEDNPKPCRKNLNIPRREMPQITSPIELARFKALCNQLGYKSRKVTLHDVKKLNIYTSQNEINESKAMSIPTRPALSNGTMPVIMLRNKEGSYMIVDGHHRWLAHHLKGGPLKILQININSLPLQEGFNNIIQKLKELDTNQDTFFKGYDITHSKKKKRKGKKTQKRLKKSSKRKSKISIQDGK